MYHYEDQTVTFIGKYLSRELGIEEYDHSLKYFFPSFFLLDKTSLLKISHCIRWLKSIFLWNIDKKSSPQYTQGTRSS